MGYLGILEPKKGTTVPGTIILDDQAAHTQDVTSGLKHAGGKHHNIILTPQPSDDPNDPLNFSRSRKLLMLAITGLGTCIFGATIPPLLNAGVVQIALELDVSINKVVQASGYQLLVVAASATLVNACARKFGKRPVFLASSLLGLIGSAVGAGASNYNQLLTARIIQGFSSSAYESIIVSMVGDLFFVHERGIYTALINFLLGAISNFSSVICGPITTNLGWKYLFRLLLVFGGLQLILQFLFVPETVYKRDQRLELDENGTGTTTTQSLSGEPKVESVHVQQVSPDNSTLERVSTVHAPHTFVQRLAVFTGIHTNENFFLLIFGPFATCLNVAVLWVVLTSGYFLSIYVSVAYLMSQLFTAPPYLLTSSGVGYLFIGPFLGGLIAAVIAASLNDPIVRFCARRNNGIYEPEYRLILTALGVFAIAGFTGWGFAAQAGMSYYLTAFCHGVGLFGIMFVLISTANYALDSYREMSSEIFLASMAAKNIIIYAYSYFINDWAVTGGPAQVLWVLCAVAAGVLMTLPIVFFFGKRYRLYWSRHNLVAKLHIVTHEE